MLKARGTSPRGRRGRDRGAVVAVRAQPAARAPGVAWVPVLCIRRAPRTATTRPTLVAFLLLLSHLIVAMPARSFLHGAANGRAAGRLTCSRHAGYCPPGEPYVAWGRHGDSSALGELSVLRLRGGVDNTRYYEVLKLPVGEEDENVSELLLPAVPRSCAPPWPCQTPVPTRDSTDAPMELTCTCCRASHSWPHACHEHHQAERVAMRRRRKLTPATLAPGAYCHACACARIWKHRR